LRLRTYYKWKPTDPVKAQQATVQRLIGQRVRKAKGKVAQLDAFLFRPRLRLNTCQSLRVDTRSRKSGIREFLHC